MQYNDEQQQLIDAPIDEIVIGASAAGSGKSTTLVARAKKILQNKMYTSGQVMLISFTRNAAEDLRKKLQSALTDEEMKRVITGTYHSIMGKMIRAKAIEVGLQPNFSIVDEYSTLTLYQRMVQESPEYNDLFRRWTLHSDDYDRDKKLGKREYNIIANTISLMINNAQPEQLLNGAFDKDMYQRLSHQQKDFHWLPQEMKERVVDALYKIFQNSIIHARETNVITYDMILFISYLMAKNGLLRSFQQTIIHTIVDEFQDSNYLQDAWVRAIAGNHLTLIGDVDQSIYSFRGGRPSIMDNYTHQYKVYNLSLNYRSMQNILSVGNTIIERNHEGKASRKPMNAFRTESPMTAVRWYEAEYDSQEADHIIQVIQTLHEKQGIAYEEMAILVRSRMTLAVLNKRLQLAKIPLNDTTRFADFMKSEVMVDMLNFIKIFTNPKDIYAFMATLDRPKRGIGPVALQKLEMASKKHEQSIIEFILSDNIDTLTPSLKRKVIDYKTIYQSLLDHNKELTLSEAVDYLLQHTGYIKWANGLKDNERILHNIDLLQQMVLDYEKHYQESNGDKEYTLYDIANQFTFDMTSAVKEESPEGVTISTIHGAKGLEWRVVFVVGVEQGTFPLVTQHIDWEDERRLMYVATTRAKDILLYYTTKYRVTSNGKELEPSALMLETGVSPQYI